MTSKQSAQQWHDTHAFTTQGNALKHNWQGRTEPPGSLVLARWAGWSAGQVDRHVKFWSSQMKSIESLHLPLIAKTKVLSEVLNPQVINRHQVLYSCFLVTK